MSRGRSGAAAAKSRSSREDHHEVAKPNSIQTSRETVESIVVAVILAFLFRAFVAEAFVIPTGSMAPTLQGRHLDVVCEQCGYQYRTGASRENGPGFRDDDNRVRRSRCPICRYEMVLDRSRPGTMFLALGNEDSFNGDRILVSKFAYELAEPRRWDVIVFKYPGNAKQNYIKRLIGLPGETILIRHGDIFVADESQSDEPLSDRTFHIARKPADRAYSMMQLVDDTHHIADALRDAGWPSRWQQASEVPFENTWDVSEDGRQFRVDAGDQPSWLRYWHLVPWPEDWEVVLETGELPDRLDHYRGQLILDHYAYNDAYPLRDTASRHGTSWVGDLAVEAEVEVDGDSGELLLKLVEGGVDYVCSINVADGQATLTIDGGKRPFVGPDGESVDHTVASTSVRGPGKYRLRFANMDDKLFLWVDGDAVEFEQPTTFESPSDIRPEWTPEDPADLAPAGIAARDLKLYVDRLRIFRDIYYLALEADHRESEYEYALLSVGDVMKIVSNPHEWQETTLFSSRRGVVFPLEKHPEDPAKDQFFPLGDNSPQSKDARLWSRYGTSDTGYFDPGPYVERKYLIGKAVLIYWPHAWRPFWPNIERMGLIR